MKASYLGISGLTHLAVAALICFAAFETVNLTEQPREMRETEVIDIGTLPGPRGNTQAQGNASNSGPRIRTPNIKIPHYDIPTAEERAAAEAEAAAAAAQAETTTTKPTHQVRTPPKPNGPRMTQAEFEAAHPSKPGKVTSVKPTGKPVPHPASSNASGNGEAGSDRPGQNVGGPSGDEGAGGAAFDQIVCQRIKAALDSYKASRDDLKVFVSFVITASGRLTAASIQQPSGDTAFDQAALAALRQVSVAPVPRDYVGQLLAVTISSRD